jgi:ribosomal protein S18 acetylase RimI-like enzyme
MQARRGELIDALGDGGLVAVAGTRRVGLLTWRLGPDRRAEITAVAVDPGSRRRGVGRALLDEAARRLRELTIDRVWLVTTNDNLEALALYQKAGYRLATLRAGAIDDVRRRIKPSIPEIASNGIPIRDELDLELEL